MTKIRSFALRVHIGRHQAHYSLVHRTQQGASVWDRRLSAGQLDLPASEDGVHDVLDLLERALHDLARRHGYVPAAPAAREPRGAVGGGAGTEQSGPHLRVVPPLGQPLDSVGGDE